MAFCKGCWNDLRFAVIHFQFVGGHQAFIESSAVADLLELRREGRLEQLCSVSR